MVLPSMGHRVVPIMLMPLVRIRRSFLVTRARSISKMMLTTLANLTLR